MSVPSRAGFTLLEALLSLLLGLLLGVLALGTLAKQRAVQADLARRGEVLATLRTARHVLGRDLRDGDGSAVVGADTLAIRAFRGTALVCPGGGGDARELLVRPVGVRAPDPEKDSVQLLDLDGRAHLSALEARELAGAVCPEAPGVAFERWRLSAPPGERVMVARWFERGSYHLSGGALRYRRGAAGRQPLTPEVLDTPPSRFAVRSGALFLELFTAAGAASGQPHTFALRSSPRGN